MEEKTDILGLLDMMTRPGFCVKDNMIVKTNSAAAQLMLETGTDIRTLLITGIEEWESLTDGCLYLTLRTPCTELNTSVTQMGDYRVFLADQDSQDAVFHAMALVSRELRKPLDTVMHLTDQLLAEEASPYLEQTAQLNKGLYQILRIVSNLSYPSSADSAMELRDVGAIVDEILEKAQVFLGTGTVRLSYTGLKHPVYTLVNESLLERAVLNLLSNAIKFTPVGGLISVSLALKGNRLQLQVRDSGSGIAEQVRNDLFYRYLRQPGIEDSRYGLGLGMVLVRSCAVKHGGTVLVDRPKDGGSRITMTLAIRQAASDRFRSPLNQWYDYAGGRDHVLVELSECLHADNYDNTK